MLRALQPERRVQVDSLQAVLQEEVHHFARDAPVTGTPRQRPAEAIRRAIQGSGEPLRVVRAERRQVQLPQKPPRCLDHTSIAASAHGGCAHRDSSRTTLDSLDERVGGHATYHIGRDNEDPHRRRRLSGRVGAGDLSRIRFTVVSDLAEPLERACKGEALVLIDIPIGLSDCRSRPVDLEARRLLGRGQGSRVFRAPCRAALDGQTYEECCALSRAAVGVALSRQARASKIREADRLMTPELQSAVREVHPEVAFCVLAGGPLAHRKKTREGQDERRAILRAHGVVFDPHSERGRLGRSRVGTDDLVDAAVALVTASRIAAGTAQVLGDGSIDPRGLRMEMLA